MSQINATVQAICPKCNATLTSTKARRCFQCNTEFAEGLIPIEGKLPPMDAPQVESESVTCGKCGTVNDFSETTKCKECGEYLHQYRRIESHAPWYRRSIALNIIWFIFIPAYLLIVSTGDAYYAGDDHPMSTAMKLFTWILNLGTVIYFLNKSQVLVFSGLQAILLILF